MMGRRLTKKRERKQALTYKKSRGNCLPGHAAALWCEPFGLRNEDCIEPFDMGSEETHHISHVEHGEEGAEANELPVPMSHEDVHEEDAKTDQTGIGTYLHLAEILMKKLGNGKWKAFAGKHERIATHLAGYAESQQCATNKQFGEAKGIAGEGVDVEGNLQKTSQPHGEVGVKPKEQADEDLRELQFVEFLSQEHNLRQDEEDVHDDGELSHGERHSRHQRQHVRRGGDGR